MYSATPFNIFSTRAYSLNMPPIFKCADSSKQLTLAEIVFMLHIYIDDMLSMLCATPIYDHCITNLFFDYFKHL